MRKSKFKKVLAYAIVLCVIFSGGVGTLTASAANLGFIGFEPFASPVISGISASISSSHSSFVVTLNQTYSGTVTANVQRLNNGVWQNHANICTNDSFNSNTISKSKSISLTSGTYRIHVVVRINNVDYPATSGLVSIP
jgi:hypothetical protein